MGQHFKTAWRHIRRVPYQALAAIFIMAITFFVATILAMLTYASSKTLNYFETRPQIIAFLKDDATPDKISGLERDLSNDQRIKNIKYVSKEQALGIYKEATSDNPLLSEFVSPKIFPASLEFSVMDLSFTEPIIKEIKDNSIIDEVVFTASLGKGKDVGQVIENLKTITKYIRIGGISIVSIFLVSSLFILLLIIGMRVASRREEIEVFKLLGATKDFIRMPFIVEGVMYAVFGSFLGWISAAILILYSAPAILSYFGPIEVFPQETSEFILLLIKILGAEIALAFVLGLLGSLTALSRYLKI